MGESEMDMAMDVMSESVSVKEYMPDMINVDKLKSMDEVERSIYLSLLNSQGYRSEIRETLQSEGIIISRRDYNINKVNG